MGLDAIFSATAKTNEVRAKSEGVNSILITHIKSSPFQARKLFSESAILELASSISQHGLLQPIILRKINETHYELLAGERRLRAMQMLHKLTIPAIICSVDDATAMAFGLIENIQRENLNPIEEAAAYERLLIEFKLSHDALAEKIGKSRSHMTNMLRLNRLPVNVKNYLIQEKISMGHARAILVLPEDKQTGIVAFIISRGLSVRQTEELVKNALENKVSQKINFEITNELKKAITVWQQKLRDKYSADIKIAFTKEGKARLQLEVESVAVLSQLIDNNLLKL
ncbi:MAG: hypothetical protein A3E82_00495 [Gammaproteobacteria bacterium RIFCSPHIGHO2_12_FULL_38_11]|nr:MAG: hypothetical protein A3E82_00495 [Gammaproteobacteria bacterium RIFCSPHIGHO2_12_FULL_38_11]